MLPSELPSYSTFMKKQKQSQNTKTFSYIYYLAKKMPKFNVSSISQLFIRLLFSKCCLQVLEQWTKNTKVGFAVRALETPDTVSYQLEGLL